MKIKKLIRTLQSFFPKLKPLKEKTQINFRRVFRVPHDKDFYALQAFQANPNECWLDVGANYGQSISSILLFQPNVKIFSFEPNKLLAAKLKRQFRNYSNIEIKDFGLADARGCLTLFVLSYRGYIYDGLASFDKNEAKNWISADTVYYFNPKRLKINELKCEINTLDDLNLRPFFIKIDVQGYELQVILGAKETISKYLPIMLIESNDNDSDILDFLSQYGYKLYRYIDSKFYKDKFGGKNYFLIPDKKIKYITNGLVV